MISLEEEKSKILLNSMPYLRPLYIKGIISMYKILSISWKDSLIDLQNKYNNLKTNDNNNKNIIGDVELKEIKNKMFLIFSFMNHFYQMINKGKLKKYDGLDFIYSKLNNFLTFSRQIISYKILDINFDEFSQLNSILKLLIHIKLFLIFCEYDTYQTPQGFINAILLILTPKENSFEEIKDNNNLNNITKDDNKDNNIINNNNAQNEEKKVIDELIIDIKKEKIELDKISLFVKNKYNSICEKYKQFIDEDKYTLFTILYETYFDLNKKEKEDEKQKQTNKKENINIISSDEDEEESKKEEESKNCDSEKKKKKRKHKKKKKKNKNNENKIISLSNNGNKIINKSNNSNELNSIKEINNNNINEINIKNKDIIDNKNERDEITKENINKKITTIKTIQSIAKFVNKLIISNSSCQENKIDFDKIKRQFFEPLIPYIEQYKKIYGNKKMPILYILQCAFITFEEKHRKEKEKLLKEIDNLKRSMNQMYIQIQLMGGGRDIFRSTLYYFILIFIPEEQNIPSFFIKVQKLINYFQNKVNTDLLLLKNIIPSPGTNFAENTNQIIKRLHQNSQYVLFIKSIFFMYKYCNYLVHLNKNEKLQNQNNNNINYINNINNENFISNEIVNNNIENINNESLIPKINTKNIKYNLPVIKSYFPEENSISILNTKKDMIYPTYNFNDCFCSYANFLDEMVVNEKTQIIIEQVIEKIEKENNQGDVPKFEINDLFSKKDGKRIFNLTGFDVQVIIHNIKKLKYKNETLENLVNSKTWENSQQEH